MPAAGPFAALTFVNIRDARMDSRELEQFVSCGCPRLEELAVRLPPFLTQSVVCIRAESLRRLDYHIKNTRRLEVAAPSLERLSMSNADRAYITAPELGEVAWEDDSFNPLRHQFTETGRRLRRLVLTLSSTTAELLQRFYNVDQLIVDILIPHVSLQFLCGLVIHAQSPANAWLQSMRNTAIDKFSKCRLKVLNNLSNVLLMFGESFQLDF